MLRTSPPTPSPVAAGRRATPAQLGRAAVALGALVLVLQWATAFDDVDRWIVGRMEAGRAPPDRDAAPLIVAIDEATVAALGPPPWSETTWVTITEALYASGIERAWLVDPWPTLLVLGDEVPGGGAQRAEVLVPKLVAPAPDDPGLPRVLDPPASGPLTAWDHHLSLPTWADGVVRDLDAAANHDGVFGPSAFCTWNGRCPSGAPLSLQVRTPGEGAGLPAVSLIDLVRGARRPSEPDARRTALVGVTDPWRARAVRIGPNAELRTWPEAIGSTIATARTTLPTPRPGPIGQTLILLCALALSVGLTRIERQAERDSALLLTPLAIGGIALAAIAARVAIVPVTAIALIVSVPPVVAVIGSRGVARRFLRSVALLLAQDGIRYAWRDTRIRTREELAEKLATLLKPRFPEATGGYLHLGRRGRLQLTQTPGGLDAVDLAPGQRRERERLFELAAAHDTGARADGLLVVPGGLRALPVRDSRRLVGFWLVAWDADAPEPDPLVLADLARWVGRHLALYEGLNPSQWRERLRDRLESDTEAVRRLVGTASEERRRQVRALHALDLPLLTTDLAGTMQFANQAMTELLTSGNLGHLSNLPDLVAALDPDDRSEDLRRLFLAGAPLTLKWKQGSGSWMGTVQSVARPTDEGDEEVLGYVLFARDLTASQQLEAMRASVLGFASNRVRNALMVVMGYARMLGAKIDEPSARLMLDAIGRNADDVATAIDELKALAGLEEEPDRQLEIDFGRMVREAINDALWFAEMHRVEMTSDVPDVSLPVLAPASKSRDTLDLLLDVAILSASPGSRVAVQVEERPDSTALVIAWSGPGLDPALLAVCHGPWHEDLGSLPRELRPFARARTVFPDLVIRSAVGEGTEVRFTLARAGRT